MNSGFAQSGQNFSQFGFFWFFNAQKLSPMLSKIVSNDQKNWAEFRNVYIVWSGPLNGTFSVHARYTGRARLYSVMHGACTFDSDNFTHWYIHFWNQPNFSDDLRPFWPKLETLFEKIFFFTQGSPFWFLSFEKSEKSKLQKILTWFGKTTIHLAIWDP